MESRFDRVILADRICSRNEPCKQVRAYSTCYKSIVIRDTRDSNLYDVFKLFLKSLLQILYSV